jgi:hypothetical protein
MGVFNRRKRRERRIQASPSDAAFLGQRLTPSGAGISSQFLARINSPDFLRLLWRSKSAEAMDQNCRQKDQVAPHYFRANDEGRTLIQSAMSSTADLEVTQSELVVTLAPLSSGHRTRAIAALCEALNASETTFPGSCLRLRYAVRQPA